MLHISIDNFKKKMVSETCSNGITKKHIKIQFLQHSITNPKYRNLKLKKYNFFFLEKREWRNLNHDIV